MVIIIVIILLGLLDTIETGMVDQPEQFKEICTRLVSKDNMKFCPGLDKEEYQHYRDIIRYDLKNVRIATSPIERIDSCKCRQWFRVPKNAPLADKSCESVMCSAWHVRSYVNVCVKHPSAFLRHQPAQK